MTTYHKIHDFDSKEPQATALTATPASTLKFMIFATFDSLAVCPRGHSSV